MAFPSGLFVKALMLSALFLLVPSMYSSAVSHAREISVRQGSNAAASAGSTDSTDSTGSSFANTDAAADSGASTGDTDASAEDTDAATDSTTSTDTSIGLVIAPSGCNYGGDSCCQEENQCDVDEGDCDHDDDCKEGLVCGVNNCPWVDLDGLEFDSKDDCCYDPTVTSGCVGDDSCCSDSNPCFEDEGDCDNDEDCQEGLVCGENNCPVKEGFDWDSKDDCCTSDAAQPEERAQRDTPINPDLPEDLDIPEFLLAYLGEIPGLTPV